MVLRIKVTEGLRAVFSVLARTSAVAAESKDRLMQ